MPLEIIGAGFGRTGTVTVKLALEQLGFGPCYHMMEVFRNPEHIALWDRAAEGQLPDWDALFAKFRATVDWPASAFWRELAAAYPAARVLLTVRDAEEWYTSAAATVFRMTPDVASSDVGRAQLVMAKKLVSQRTFGGRTDDRAHCVDVFNRHNAEVQRELGDRVLVYDVRQGWEPLCAWLGVAVPDTPLPRTNTTQDFQQRNRLS